LTRELRYAVSREDLINLIKSLRRLFKDHKTKLIIMGYSRIERWIDWQAEKHDAPCVKIDPDRTSSECPKCNFEADRDVVGKLNVRKKGLKTRYISS